VEVEELKVMGGGGDVDGCGGGVWVEEMVDFGDDEEEEEVEMVMILEEEGDGGVVVGDGGGEAWPELGGVLAGVEVLEVVAGDGVGWLSWRR